VTNSLKLAAEAFDANLGLYIINYISSVELKYIYDIKASWDWILLRLPGYQLKPVKGSSKFL